LDRAAADAGAGGVRNIPFAGAFLPNQSFSISKRQSGAVDKVLNDTKSKDCNLFFVSFLHFVSFEFWAVVKSGVTFIPV
jgi:hypothetical protein